MNEYFAFKIGTDIVLTLINNTINNSINIINYITANRQKCDNIAILHKCLEENDLEFKIKLIRDMIVESNGKQSSGLIVTGLRDIIEKIEVNITLCKDKIENHRQLWFNSWRRLDISENITALNTLSKILNERIKLFNLFI